MRIEEKEVKLKSEKKELELSDAEYALIQAIQNLTDAINALRHKLK